MKKSILYLVFIIILSNSSFGQYKYEIQNGSKNYFAKMNVENCLDDHCEGNGTINLFDKETKKLIQTFTSDDLYFYYDTNKKPTVNVIQLYNEQSPLIFDDFNFDGSEDLAIRNGNHSSYGGPSYDIYVSNLSKTKFFLSSELTELVEENLGMFETDSKRKRIITYSKSGCCWHQKSEYMVIPNKGLKLVYIFEEDATGGEFVKVITKKLIKNKWKVKIEKFKLDEYYKD